MLRLRVRSPSAPSPRLLVTCGVKPFLAVGHCVNLGSGYNLVVEGVCFCSPVAGMVRVRTGDRFFFARRAAASSRPRARENWRDFKPTVERSASATRPTSRSGVISPVTNSARPEAKNDRVAGLPSFHRSARPAASTSTAETSPSAAARQGGYGGEGGGCGDARRRRRRRGRGAGAGRQQASPGPVHRGGDRRRQVGRSDDRSRRQGLQRGRWRFRGGRRLNGRREGLESAGGKPFYRRT